ncbi:MAG: glycosyltransferase N-terminal domain-containing protein [Bacteroidales bacterium]|nr:glycosyltransferase N-terminal domain-containing protein [Bacteroidales bacterium]
MYTLGIYFYIFFVKLAALFGHKKAKQMLAGHKEVFKVLEEKVKPGTDYVWFHASSLGEFEQGRPMIEKLRSEHPEYRVVLTFFSPSGYNPAKNYQQADIVCYLPFDTKRNVKHFLDILQPKMAFFIKYEFWMNFLLSLNKRSIPVYSVSSIFRKEQAFFKSWGGRYRLSLHCFNKLFVQNEQSRNLLKGININNVEVVGDTRFDRVAKILEQARQLPLVDAFVEGCDKVFIAGSSWGADESIYMQYFNAHKEWKLIIASHEVNDERVKAIEKQYEGLCVRYTRATMDEVREARCLIIDCYGLLSSIYRYATVAYVGGGFGVGIHNVLEAAVYGVPVLFGPNNKKFQEAQALIECGGGVEILGISAFNEKMDAFVSDPLLLASSSKAAGDYVMLNSGASERIFKSLGL